MNIVHNTSVENGENNERVDIAEIQALKCVWVSPLSELKTLICICNVSIPNAIRFVDFSIIIGFPPMQILINP